MGFSPELRSGNTPELNEREQRLLSKLRELSDAQKKLMISGKNYQKFKAEFDSLIAKGFLIGGLLNHPNSAILEFTITPETIT